MSLTVLSLLHYTPTPLQEIRSAFLDKAAVRLLVKREDLNHHQISGNKWWKLKYNLAEASRQQKKTLLTFGGAYSNHIYATAAAARALGFESIGVIRGEEQLPLNPTLLFAKRCGMQIQYVSREEYRNKTQKDFTNKLREQFGDFYLIPEGGTNELAVKGCEELALTFAPIDFDYLCLPVGTGGTMAGIIKGLAGQKKVIGFSALRGGQFLDTEIKNLLKNSSSFTYQNWMIDSNYHFGGYAKTTKELQSFITRMKTQHHLSLDHVYTGKLLKGVMDYIENGKFKRGTSVLVLHTGGLQGADEQVNMHH